MPVQTPVLSPYLRPVWGRARGRRALFLDDATRGSRESLPPVEEAVVRGLWSAGGSGEGLDRLRQEYGADVVAGAFARLLERQLAFQGLAEAHEAANKAISERTTATPLVDQVELTNACPMRCRFCARGVPGRITRPSGCMELQLFERLLDQLPEEQRCHHPLELNNFGESLLHPEVDRFVAAASARGFQPELSVNPALLSEHLARRLLDARLARLVVSLDGADEETLGAIRGPAASYARSERNLDTLIELAARRENPPSIVIQMIAMERNIGQRESFLARWGRTGAPFVTAYLKALDGPDPDTGHCAERPVRYLCTYPFRSVVVLWDGRVVPCCRDYDAGLVLGDLRAQTLQEIWQSEPAKALRRAWLSHDFPDGHPCEACPWNRRSFVEAMSERHPDLTPDNPLDW